MMWLTWRQFRAQALVALAALVVFGVAFGLTASHLSTLYTSSGASSCHAPANCTAAFNAFLGQMKADGVYPALFFLGTGVLILGPALIGAFWGAPLITREVEGHTLRLAWHQSVTRTRWIVVKLAVLGLAAMAATEVFSLLISWWADPIDSAGGFPVNDGYLSRFAPQIFDARGVTPLGYAAFAYVLGVLLGLVIKRTVPAMAVTLVVFAAIQIAFPTFVRPSLVTPMKSTSLALTATALDKMMVASSGTLTVPVDIPGAWIVSNTTVTAGGKQFILPTVPDCQTGTHDQCVSWLSKQDLHQAVSYQPASRYWRFQWIETTIFLAAAAILAALCVLSIRRGRLS
jgi:hypothetical protein